MKIGIVGAGPAGLYFALLMKRANPAHEIILVEQNPRGATYGWGIVFSGRALAFLADHDTATYQELSAHLREWDELHIVHRDEQVAVDGSRFSGIARATLLDRLLLVSGTASVVGHATQHPYDAPAQLRETVENLRALLAEAQRQHFAAEPALRWQPRALRLYVRDAAQAASLRALAESLLGTPLPLSVLHGEICRRDLEVEIEGVFEAS